MSEFSRKKHIPTCKLIFTFSLCVLFSFFVFLNVRCFLISGIVVVKVLVLTHQHRIYSWNSVVSFEGGPCGCMCRQVGRFSLLCINFMCDLDFILSLWMYLPYKNVVFGLLCRFWKSIVSASRDSICMHSRRIVQLPHNLEDTFVVTVLRSTNRYKTYFRLSSRYPFLLSNSSNSAATLSWKSHRQGSYGSGVNRAYPLWFSEGNGARRVMAGRFGSHISLFLSFPGLRTEGMKNRWSPS